MVLSLEGCALLKQLVSMACFTFLLISFGFCVGRTDNCDMKRYRTWLLSLLINTVTEKCLAC
jgi:hypothetical protein